LLDGGDLLIEECRTTDNRVYADYPQIKIIGISGGGRVGPDDYLHIAGALGAQHTFQKPFEWGVFMVATRGLINLQKLFDANPY
jgi:hypothetical protein